MDKFDRRLTGKQRRRNVLLFLAVAALPGLWFFSLFAFGNASAPWTIGAYVVLLAVLMWVRVRELLSNQRLWALSFADQSRQGPGFTPLELAALNDMIEHSGDDGPQLRAHFSTSEVTLRLNTGSGCLTTIASADPRTISEASLGYTPWFRLDGINSTVGCRFWAGENGVDMINFFCGGEDTRAIDWAEVNFDLAENGALKPRVPDERPIAPEPRWHTYRPEI